MNKENALIAFVVILSGVLGITGISGKSVGTDTTVRTNFSLRESFNRNLPNTENMSIQTRNGAEIVAEREIPFARGTGTYYW